MCFAVRNAYPYGSGQLMGLPQRAAPDLADLNAGEAAEQWARFHDADAAIRGPPRPYGPN